MIDIRDRVIGCCQPEGPPQFPADAGQLSPHGRLIDQTVLIVQPQRPDDLTASHGTARGGQQLQ